MRCTLPFARAFVGALALAPLAEAQVERYGSSTPSTFGVGLGNGVQQSYGGNPYFALRLDGANPLGGAIFLALGRASIPVGAWTLLLDPLTFQALSFPLAPGVTEQALPLPNDPSTFGQPVDFQALLLHGLDLGATNGVEVRIQRDRTPLRAYLPGQDFSQGSNAPGQLATLDLSAWPPVFRSSANIGFAGTISNNYSAAVAVSNRANYAFLHGNGTTNQFVRVLDISADPTGSGVNHPLIGDIPLASGPTGSIARRDLEVTGDGRWLFSTSGASTIVLEVWDLAGLPGTLPTAPAQSITLGSVSGGATMLEVTADDRILGVCIGTDTAANDVILYDITGAAQPLVQRAAFQVPNRAGTGTPSALDFSPNGRRLLVVTGGTYSFYDIAVNPPNALVGGGTWTANGISTTSPLNGGALALRNGVLVGVFGENGVGGLYHLVDLSDPLSPTFGLVVSSFSTNPAGNISNHRVHAMGNVVVAIDGTGATADCQWVDVIDLDTPDPVTGYRSVRVQMPSATTLTPAGLSCIPREFELR
ncbi:MAG: hypothetical protein JNM84_16740 [Planctomycetes bacterium]|nr:hypothetical protein [Planctomycetota bacterium]